NLEVSRRRANHQAAASRISGGHSKTNQVSVGEGILLGCATDGHASVRPRSDMLGGDRGTIVVVTHIVRLDVPVRLSRERAHYIRQCIIRQPGCAVVVGLARPHLVTGNTRVTNGAAGAVARVIPRRQEGARGADRQVSLPLRTSSGISV